jgi:hypothetical protein
VFRKKKPDALSDRPPPIVVGDEEMDAAPLVPWPADRPVPEWNDPDPVEANDDASSPLGCMFYFAVMLAIMRLYDEIGLSERMGYVVFCSGPVIAAALYLWITLHDADVARADLESDTPIAPLRTWLRRVLRIRVD